jgi:hypothetical protein
MLLITAPATDSHGPLKTTGLEALLLFFLNLSSITSNLKNRNVFLEIRELTHLETANTPPFMEPKQERATKIGTANEKLPSSRSEKVCERKDETN